MNPYYEINQYFYALRGIVEGQIKQMQEGKGKREMELALIRLEEAGLWAMAAGTQSMNLQEEEKG